MGVCYSSIGGKNETREEDRWWKEKDDDVNAAADAKLKKGVSADFSLFIGKFMGGGGGGSAALSEKGLPHIPGRLFASGASRIASLYTQQGKKGTNQDAMIVWENFSSRSDAVFCGVFDGHGPYGHMVARKVRDCLPLLLRTQWDAGSNGNECSVSHNENSVRSMHFDEVMDDDWCESFEFEDKEKLPEKYLPLKQSILDSFKLMDKELSLHPTIDCFCSGTTAVTVIKQDQDLIIGNVGDSRAVLAKRDKDNSLMALQLTIDLKPNLPREAARIQKYKGRVFALQDEPEVPRVWLPNSDSPGLAMARAFGDFCLKNFGLISVPDIYYHHITERDEFIILASDGVWDVLSNKEAVDIVASAPGQELAARALVDCATRAWRLKYPTSKIDDCAVICLFLEHVLAADIEHSTLTKDLVEGSQEELKRTSATDEDTRNHNSGEVETSSSILGHCGTFKESGEITPATDEKDEKITERSLGQSKRSLAECLSTAEDEEWSALEGVARVNSLLSLPRFLSADKRSTSWRKWL